MGERNERGAGQTRLIDENGIEEHLIAGAMESGLGISEATRLVNEYRAEVGLVHVGRSTVYSAFKRMQPVITPLVKLKQGSVDEDSAWAQARFGFVTQLAIRYRRIRAPVHPVEKWFDLNQMVPLVPEQIGHFDEVHKQALIGFGSKHNKTQIRFHRDADGKLDPINGTLAAEGSQLHEKFKKEGRWMFGVAMVLKNGVRTGHRLPLFDYTGQNVVTITVWEEHEKTEIRRVRSLPHGGAWITGRRTPAEGVFELDTVDHLPFVAAAKRASLEAAGLCTVGAIKMLDTAGIQQAAPQCKMSPSVLSKLREAAQFAQPGSWTGAEIDHRRFPNPYLSKYGAGAWKHEISQCTLMKDFCCVTSLIHHMVDVTQEVMVGTHFQNNFYVYHDALSQLFCKRTKEYMVEHDVLKYFIVPVNELNKGTLFEGLFVFLFVCLFHALSEGV
jgi:hypothetical protein